MAHISVDLPSISQTQKRKLIISLQEILSEITGIDKNEISVSLHELPIENMNNTEDIIKKENIKQKEITTNKQDKKKSFFKEIFP